MPNEVIPPVHETLRKLAAADNLPDFLKSATLDSLTGESAKSSSFLVPARREFACHTKTAAYVSLHAWADHRRGLDDEARVEIDKRADAFARHWSLERDWASARDAVVKAAAAPEDVYALPAGEKSAGILKITGEGDLAASAAWLIENRDDVEFETRKEAAASMLERAALLGAEIPQDIRKIACSGIPDIDAASKEIIRRKVAAIRAGLPEEAANLQKLAETLAFNPGLAARTDTLSLLCDALHASDAATGYAEGYKAGDARPEDFLFAVGFEEAKAAAESVVRTATGSVYDKAKLAGLTSDDLSKSFGKDFADAVCNVFGVDADKFAEEAAILPLPDAELLDDLLSAKGIEPSMKRAELVPMLSEQQMLALTV